MVMEQQKLVKISDWKDKSDGVLLDLGSHLIDIIIFYLIEVILDLILYRSLNSKINQMIMFYFSQQILK